MNVFDPGAGFNAFAQGAQIGGGIRQRQTEAKLAPMVAAGDYQGAAQYAGQRGDLPSAELYRTQYGEQLKGMKAEELAAAKERAENLARTAAGLRSVPYEQRRATLQQQLPMLQGMGIDPQQLAQFDPTDQAIDGVLAQVTPLADLLKSPEYFAPTEVVGPDGKPQLAQFSNTGVAPRTYEGMAPYEAPKDPNFKQITLADGEYEYIPGQPDSLRKLGASPVRAPLVSVDVSGKQEDAFATAAGKIEAQNFGSLVEMGQTAGRNRVILDQLDASSASVPGGLEAVAKTTLGNFGIETAGLTELQATEALINQLVPAQRQPGSGPMSDKDLALFKQSLPRLIQTQEGRAKIIQNMKAINDYVAQEGRIASDVLSGRISPEEGRTRMQALGNPLSEYAGGGSDLPLGFVVIE